MKTRLVSIFDSMRNFRKLDIWVDAVRFASMVYKATNEFPNHEKYGMVSQMNRAVVSIASNIAEGCSRRTNTGFSRFLDMAMGSAFELETQIEISKRVSYLSEDVYQNLLQDLSLLQKRINAFRETLKTRS